METNGKHTALGSPADAGTSPTTGFHFDAVEHAYFLDGKPLHGITTVLGVIAKPALIQWAATEATKFTEGAEGMLYSAALDGPIPFKAVLKSVCKEASTAHRKKKEDAAEKGTDLHAEVERYALYCINENKGLAEPLNPHFVNCGIDKFINWAQENNIKFLASEQRLYSKEHWVAGTCDLVFEKDGKTYVGDVKTYKKIWDRVPFFQCAAYGMMWEEMAWDSSLAYAAVDNEAPEKPLPRMKVDGYCVLRLGKDGSFEEKWSFDIGGDRTAFLNALGLYKALKAFKA